MFGVKNRWDCPFYKRNINMGGKIQYVNFLRYNLKKKFNKISVFSTNLLID